MKIELFGFDCSYIVLVFVVLIIIVILYLFRDVIIRNATIRIDNKNVNKGWALKTLRNFAYEKAVDIFESKGRDIYTKNGDYRADFMREWDKQEDEIYSIVTIDDRFTPRFIEFAKSRYSRLSRKRIASCYAEYIVYLEDNRSKNTEKLVSMNGSVSPEEFFLVKQKMQGDKVGVYVIYNKTKDMYYVGQAKKLFFRVNQHFTGHGNGDVYADYKYGDEFVIQMVILAESGYSDIDLLEKDLIEHYGACINGYNKTVGNN